MMTATRVDLFAIAKDVAVELGDDWTATAGHWENDRDAYLIGPDGVRMHMAHGLWRMPDHQMRVSGDLGELQNFKPYNADTGEINVSMKKAPKQIANDITRRLLPIAVPTFTGALERKRAHDTEEFRRAALAEEIRAALGSGATVSSRDDHEVNLGNYGSRVRVEVDPRYESVKFKVELPPELAVLLAKALSEL
ncbi:hypothetical protein [Umezawaea sp. Da 62-37]|uniref:hypothetical protein n=1 Tax=Umezawaea sp. Da 62-37 TaxID=3075927 RepID=UPI0028F6FB53|nr:hypothetical protein [Umezawaea sp. Da 62-37]WNV90291.1 hypothetical protein RM788_19015 [Umezawaea sp. Da 62-37]